MSKIKLTQPCAQCGQPFHPRSKSPYCSVRCSSLASSIPVGTKYGLLTSLGLITEGTAPAGGRKTRFICDCGNETIATSCRVIAGKKRSCGCLRTVAGGKLIRFRMTHGMSDTPEYRAYQGAKKRCTNPTTAAYPSYGGRGIEFRFESFEEWMAELGPKPSPEMSVDRIDNNGHYERGNIRWATPTEQTLNRRKVQGGWKWKKRKQLT